MSDVRPELQRIREALGELTPLIADMPGVLPERARLVGVVTDASVALARVEATLNAQQAEIERLTTQNDYSLVAFDAAAEAIQKAHRDGGE